LLGFVLGLFLFASGQRHGLLEGLAHFIKTLVLEVMDTFGALGTEVDQVVFTHGRARLSADKCMMPPGVDVGQSDFDIDQQTLARAFTQRRYRHGVVGIEFLTGECLVTLVIIIVAALMLAALLFTQEQGLLVGVALLLEVDRAVV